MLVACTVSGDTAGQNGGGLYELNGTATLSDTIVAGNINAGGASESASRRPTVSPARTT